MPAECSPAMALSPVRLRRKFARLHPADERLSEALTDRLAVPHHWANIDALPS